MGKPNALIILQDLQERLKCSFFFRLKQLALPNADFSGYARSSHGWLNPGILQRKDMLPFSLNWADFVFQGAQEPMAPWVEMKSLGLPFLAVDEIRPDKADPQFPALSGASPAHPKDGDGALLAFFRTPLHATSVKWHVNCTLQVETPCKLASRRCYLLAWNVSWAIFLPLPPSLLPLLLPDPHLAKQMKCQEEMSLRQVSLLWGISCTLIMVFVLWVVKFPITSPVWS